MKASRLAEIEKKARGLPEGVAPHVSGPEVIWLLEARARLVSALETHRLYVANLEELGVDGAHSAYNALSYALVDAGPEPEPVVAKSEPTP